MSLPATWTTVPVTGTFYNYDGTPASGTVTFYSDQVVVIDGVIVVPADGLVATLDSTGSIAINLPSTNDPDLSVVGWAYRVVEDFERGRKPYLMLVPYDSVGIDLANIDVVEPDPVTTDPYLHESAISITVASQAAVVAAQADADAAQAAATTAQATADLAAPALAAHVAAADPHPQYATETDVDARFAALLAAAPAALDTLNELAAALGDDPNFATTVTNAIAAKIATALIGAASGVAPLNADAKVAASYLAKKRVTATPAAGALVIDLSLGADFVIAMSANVTSTVVTNGPPAGYAREGTLIFVQDATGGRTWAPPAGAKWPNGLAAVLTSTAGAVDHIGYRVYNNAGSLEYTFYPVRDVR